MCQQALSHATSKAELVLDARCGTGESPVWSAAEQALYWVDIPARALHRWSADRRTRSGPATKCSPASRRAPTLPGGWIAGMESGLFAHRAAAPTAGWPRSRSRSVGARRARHALQRRPLRPPGPLLGRHDADGHGAGARVGRALPLSTSAAELGAAASTSLIVPNGLAFSPDGRTHVPVGLAPERADASGPSTTTPTTGTPSQPPRVRRHEAAARPPRRRRGRCRRLLLDLRQRRRPGAPLHARRPARPLAGSAGEEARDVRLRRRRARHAVRHLDPPGGGDLSDQPLAGGVFALRPGVRGLPEAGRSAADRFQQFSNHQPKRKTNEMQPAT